MSDQSPLTKKLVVKPPDAQILPMRSDFCHRMSALPSPSKSLEPLYAQELLNVPKFTVLEIAVPFISHFVTVPSALRNSTSALPSPLKSPIPTIEETAGFTVVTVVVVATAPALFICQRTTVPSALCHNWSALPPP